jgi:hypothetical protein
VNRFLHEFLDLTPAIILTVPFCKGNIILLLGELPQKLFHISSCCRPNHIHGWCQNFVLSNMIHKWRQLTPISFLNYSYKRTCKNRNSLAGRATGNGLDYRGSGIRFSKGAENFSLLRRVETVTGFHPASYPVGTEGSFRGTNLPLPRRGLGCFLFTTASRPTLKPIQRPIQWVLGILFPGLKWLGCKVDHSHLM